jgi:hypothetical protein
MLLVVRPPAGMGAVCEANDAVTKKFAWKYAPPMGSKPVVPVNFGCSPKFASSACRYGREVIAAG